MQEFRPPIHPSLVRVGLAVALPLLMLVPVALAAMTLGWGGARYVITGDTLVVDAAEPLSGTRTVRLADITEARIVALHGGRRTMGTALPGYCAGRFSYSDLGEVWQVTTCASSGVLLRAKGQERPILVTPPDAADFMSRLQLGTKTTLTLPPPQGGVGVVIFLVLLVAVVSSVLVSAMLVLGPRRMRYLVGDGALEVRTLFGTKRWPTQGAHAKAYTPTKLRRVAGTAAPGYFTGIYRESGQNTRLYATEIARVLLFEGPNGRVMLSPDNRVEMLLALEAEGVSIDRHAT